MNQINSSQINQMATEIAQKLDDARGELKDNSIGTIWNEFVGYKDENSKQEVGNGEKSKITNNITLPRAIISIESYIKKKGTAIIQQALKSLGIDWTPSVEVEPNTQVKENATATPNEEYVDPTMTPEEEKEAFRNLKEQVYFSKYERTMKELQYILNRFSSGWCNQHCSPDDFDNQEESIRSQLKRMIDNYKDNQEMSDWLKDLLDRWDTAMAQKHELDNEFPNYKEQYMQKVEAEDNEKFSQEFNAKNEKLLQEYREAHPEKVNVEEFLKRLK